MTQIDKTIQKKFLQTNYTNFGTFALNENQQQTLPTGRPEQREHRTKSKLVEGLNKLVGENKNIA